MPVAEGQNPFILNLLWGRPALECPTSQVFPGFSSCGGGRYVAWESLDQGLTPGPYILWNHKLKSPLLLAGVSMRQEMKQD